MTELGGGTDGDTQMDEQAAGHADGVEESSLLASLPGRQVDAWQAPHLLLACCWQWCVE